VNIKELKSIFANNPNIDAIKECLKNDSNSKISIKGLCGSSLSMTIANVYEKYKKTMLVIVADSEDAAYIHNDLSNIVGSKELLFFPSSYKRSVQYDQKDNSNIIQRAEVLSKVKNTKKSYIILSYPEALMEKVISEEKLNDNTLELKKGEKISIEFINDILHEYKFVREDFVYEPGQFSIRGSIVDIFSYSNTDPYRIDFFGDDVETIRTFDPETQRSKESVEEITIIPNIEGDSNISSNISFIDYIPKDTIVWADNLKYSADKMDLIFENTLEKYKNEDADYYRNVLSSGRYYIEKLSKLRVLEFGNIPSFEVKNTFHFNTSLQPSFQKNFEILGQTLCDNIEAGYKNLFFTDNHTQAERLESIFKEINPQAKFETLQISLHKGYTCNEARICCYTDHQIFERYHKHKVTKKIASKDTLTLKDISNLTPGDYVVHIDHGIGVFKGLDRIEVNGKTQEAIRLVYKDNDVLYVNIHNLHKISKYKGKEASEPKIHKLGSGVWQKTKQKTKSKIKDIAKELIALYAERKAQKGFSFSLDTYMQTELEASFFFEDTPDQSKATNVVKKAMEEDTPMDVLVCGDVGFGKTEIAVRAAFKAVCDNKQVAILVPTTILALQHYKTFSSRLKDFPCRVEYVSRLKKAKEQKQILSDTKDGKVDILIGTHRLVGKDIIFKDLGLLIIDEEQKFGVGVKEKLKSIKVNVDTLTLTATPIPRTLQFSLMGARDLSIINTPPPNRHPIVTEVHSFNDDIIREAITFEMERDGQVFFINNRIQNIYEIEALINRVCPGVRTIVGHGQMDGPKLEAIMLDFINGDYDVLIATTIIESGLDIPNANTIIVNDAQNFGLSELHQLRGRVGRSNKKAFAYLLAPPAHLQTPDARRRLHAIEEFSDLGSGFKIAMQDLDIRGAGNLLGGEQSGFISDIGFETYQKILDEAMLELKENEYKEFYSKQSDNETIEIEENHQFVVECQVDTDFELLFPISYISNTTERIKQYRDLDNVQNEQELEEFENELIDRFGHLPKESKALLDIVRLRWKACRLGIEKIILKNGIMICYFISNKDSIYFQSAIFMKILNFVQSNSRLCQMMEKNNKLTLRFGNINSVEKSISVLTKIENVEKKYEIAN
jgi:transcription-repair coupling factor (superfamily II helicase)